ncbi:DUF1634 domain-containing protein [Leptolyngbya sp. AN02str]|uniref:DUF1634 domain-containing protein n=1 Tax=Leptolyngbya sp. AN02str TaxID=3423363 RepID=UPI003D30EFBD
MPVYDSEVEALSCPIDQSLQARVDAAAHVLANLPADAIANVTVDAPVIPEVDVRSPDYELGRMISAVLKYGVIISSLVVLVGGLFYLARHGMEPVHYHIFEGEPAEFCSPWGVMQAIAEGRYRGVVQLGLLLLIATPIVRVIVSFGYFIYKRDRIYSVITLLVMSGLLYSFLGAYH